TRCTPRDAAKPSVASALPGINRCTLTLPMCRRGFSRFHWTGRIELPTPRSNGGVGNVGLAITNRGVAGGFVTVTIRFCWFIVLKYSPYPPRTDVDPSPNTSQATPVRGAAFV